MFTPDQYELLDFGEGRKLERFGSYVIDRPALSADRARQAKPLGWQAANAQYVRPDHDSGSWLPEGGLPSSWTIAHPSCSLELRPTPFGQVGVFPEQAANWDWIVHHIGGSSRPWDVLNLFAYTGGSTLAAASAGARVVHVDAAKNVVEWARRNAELTGLHQAPIRWIKEDVRRFTKREVRRGNRYDAIILDPPSYGHGPRGEAWKIEPHLPDLLRDCRELTKNRLSMFLLSCHSPRWDAARLRAVLAEQLFGTKPPELMIGSLSLEAADGRRLPCGVAARWCGGQDQP